MLAIGSVSLNVRTPAVGSRQSDVTHPYQALLEIKIFIFALIKNFVLEDTGETIISQFSSTLQPRVKGKEHLGVQLPVRISLYTP